MSEFIPEDGSCVEKFDSFFEIKFCLFCDELKLNTFYLLKFQKKKSINFLHFCQIININMNEIHDIGKLKLKKKQLN